MMKLPFCRTNATDRAAQTTTCGPLDWAAVDAELGAFGKEGGGEDVEVGQRA